MTRVEDATNLRRWTNRRRAFSGDPSMKDMANKAGRDSIGVDLLYGVAAIAEYIGVKKRQAQYQIERGSLPHFKMGRTICARKSKISAWIDACEAGTDPAGGEG